MSEFKRVTYADIAREAGVSITTVSLVLRGMANVPDDTRAQVLEIARRLGYLPRPATQSLNASHIRELGVLVKSYKNEDPFENAFYRGIIDGIKEVCLQYRINVSFSIVPVNAQSCSLEVPQMLIDSRMNGVLALGLNLNEESTMQIDRYGVPIVLVDAYSDTNAFDSVGIANYQGAYEAVAYLISLGHRHIGIVGSTPDAFPGISDRRRGYLQALQDNDIRQSYLIDSLFDPDETYLACLQYLKQKTHLTAIFGVDDWVIQGAMRAVQELGLKIPDDVSFVGFDDIIAAQLSPPITSMLVDLAGMGRTAVRMLMNRVENPTSALIKTALRPKLTVRQSTRRVELF